MRRTPKKIGDITKGNGLNLNLLSSELASISIVQAPSPGNFGVGFFFCSAA
jgi:hypothetical protein